MCAAKRKKVITDLSSFEKIEMGKEPDSGKNEQNPGFAKNRTEPESKNMQEPDPTEPNPIKNRTEPEPKCRGSYSVLSLNEIVGTFTHFPL